MKHQAIKYFTLLFTAVLFCGCSDDPEGIIWEGDITDELRAELLAGNDIALPGGTFFVSEAIIVEGYCGIVQGAADGTTIIENSTEEPFVAVYDPNIGSGKISNMFAIYHANCDVTFQNLTFNIKGAAPAEAHNNPWLQTRTTIDNVIVVNGGNEAASTVTYKNLIINAEKSSDAGAVNGRNLAWALIIGGSDDPEAKPVDGIIENCTINNSGKYAIEYLWVENSVGTINNNIIDNSQGIVVGWGSSDMNGTTVDIKNNQFSNMIGSVLVPDGTPTICFMNNTLNGVAMDDDCPQ